MAPEMIFLVKRNNCGLQTWHEVVAPAFSRRIAAFSHMVTTDTVMAISSRRKPSFSLIDEG
jgi:hypothetical protein